MGRCFESPNELPTPLDTGARLVSTPFSLPSETPCCTATLREKNPMPQCTPFSGIGALVVVVFSRITRDYELSDESNHFFAVCQANTYFHLSRRVKPKECWTPPERPC